MQCLSYAFAKCKPLEINVPTLFIQCIQLPLKITDVAENDKIGSDILCFFFTGGAIIVCHSGYICQHNYKIVGRKSIGQPYRIMLRYTKQGFCIAMLGCAFFCPRLQGPLTRPLFFSTLLLFVKMYILQQRLILLSTCAAVPLYFSIQLRETQEELGKWLGFPPFLSQAAISLLPSCSSHVI